MYKIEENKNKFIEGIAILTGIGEEKLNNYSKENSIFNILEHPNVIELTENQYEKVMLLNHIISTYDLVKNYEKENKVCISSPERIVSVFKPIVANLKEKEKFMVGFLDNKNYIIEVKTLSEGSINAANVCIRNMLKMAINNDCTSLILCHNHPSGNPVPSEEDIRVTNDIVNAFDSIKIKILDHVILGDGKFYSFEKEGVMSNGKITYAFNNIFSEQQNQGISF